MAIGEVVLILSLIIIAHIMMNEPRNNAEAKILLANAEPCRYRKPKHNHRRVNCRRHAENEYGGVSTSAAAKHSRTRQL